MKFLYVILFLTINATSFSQTLKRYPFEETNAENTLIAEGKYNEKKEMTGEWKYYYPGKELHSIGNYQDGKQVGVWKMYYKSGKLQQESNLNQIIGYYENGIVEYEWNNDKEGAEVRRIKSTYYNKDGSLKFKLLNDSINDKEIPYSFFYSKRLLTYEGFYSPFKGAGHNNKIDGKYYSYYKNGKLKEITNYSQYWLAVEKTRYFKNEQLKSHTRTYKNKYDGEFIYYTKKGQLITKIQFKNNKAIGKYFEYYKNGRIKEETEYNDKGKLIGKPKLYKKSGGLKK